MNKPVISIIVPIYNVELYVENCLKSVMNQSYDGHIECILVDDCGTDNSMEIVERLVSDYKGSITFKILHHTHNRGLSAARNTGMDAAIGDYVYFLDSDDEITPACISLLVEAVKKYPDVEMVQGQVKSVPYKSLYDISSFKNIEFINDNLWVRKHYYAFEDTIPVNVWGKLIKLSFLKDNSLYNKEGLLHEDEQWMFFVVKVLSKISFVHQDTYIHYRDVVGSIMSTNNMATRAFHWSVILDDVIHNIDAVKCKAQLLLYIRKVAIYYGYEGKVSYDQLVSDYCKAASKERLYLLRIMLQLLKVTFPLIKGKGIKRLIYNMCYWTWKRHCR